MDTKEPAFSHEEMTALRDAVQPAAIVAPAEERAAQVEVLPYNFRQPGQLSFAQLRALKVVHEFFAKRLAEARIGGLDVGFELSLLSVETVSYNNFMGSLPNPSFLGLLSSRFEQKTLLELDLPFLRSLVDRLLGGQGKAGARASALTPVEESISSGMVRQLLPLLDEAWELSAPVSFDLQSVESDPRFVQVMPDDDAVVSLTFGLVAGAIRGQLTLCYPLEPLQQLLEGMSQRMTGRVEEDGDAQSDSERMLGALKAVPLEMRAELGQSTILASQLAQLAKGDVLCLDKRLHEPLQIFVGKRPVFQARLGHQRDSLALQIVSRNAVNP